MERLVRYMITTPLLVLSLLSRPALAEPGSGWQWQNWWLTLPQQGQRAYERGDYAEAAKLFRDPMRIGIAHYRAGDFDLAAAAFGRVNTPEAAFNQANALVFQGEYAAAIEAYDRALALQPEWLEAQENRAIALARLARREASQEQKGEATEIGADDVVFDLDNKSGENQDEIETEGGQGMSEQELRALWLRKSQTSPAVFMKAKFAAQLALENEQETQQ